MELHVGCNLSYIIMQNEDFILVRSNKLKVKQFYH
jgi:hypothetical protein